MVLQILSCLARSTEGDADKSFLFVNIGCELFSRSKNIAHEQHSGGDANGMSFGLGLYYDREM